MRGTAIGALIIILCCAGCDSIDDHGYLEVKSSFTPRDGDVYWYRETALRPGDDGKLDAVVREPIGASRIFLQRGSEKYGLCDVRIRKDRVTSVSLSNDQGHIICKVSD